VSNDTAPEATDKLFLWRAVKGWFYVRWQKLTNIFFAGGGFKANLYFTARDSDVESYKLLSYQNDAEPTTLTASLGADYTLLRSYIFNLPFGDSTIPEGLWKSILYGMVSSSVGDTTLRLDGFMRTGAGVETVIFSVESDSIKNTDLDSIPNEEWLLQLTVDPASYFGVKLYGKTTKGGGVTLTAVVGGANASYLITPAATDHNLLRRRDQADCHPAKAVTFNVDPVPDFTAVVKGNTLEAIGHKVAGLQDTVVFELTTSVLVAEILQNIEITGDFAIIIRCPSFVESDLSPSARRAVIQLNGISSNVYGWTTSYQGFLPAANTGRLSQYSSSIFYRTGTDYIGNSSNYFENGSENIPFNTKGLDAQSGINSVRIYVLSGTLSCFPIGTHIKIIRL
jgi:hypothetical protein